uniref:hypothetical protein n=1 Tax=Acetatifactor sp. TaxID=1872090 RepID=UPI0040579D80
MKIDSSTIGMESARSYKASNVTVRRFMITEYQAGLTQSDNTLNTAVSDNQEDVEENSSQTTEKKSNILEEWENRYKISASRIKLRESVDNTLEDIRQVTIRYIFDLLFASRRERFNNLFQKEGISDREEENITSDEQVSNNGNVFLTNFKVMSYTQETIQVEREETAFSTVGTVRTADGREINFNVNVGMSREFQQYYRENLELASFKMCDPLVINLNTDVAELSDQKFFFDIDADGEKDEISQLNGNSGYLALDKNGDGTINDGSELFGTASGDGFADLEEYDQDGNGWIDENDEIWSKLKIWCKDENGNDILYRLAEKGVGAICLQRAATDFMLQGGDGQTKGAIRSTGIFLYENGGVGTVQHVDVAKYDKEV